MKSISTIALVAGTLFFGAANSPVVAQKEEDRYADCMDLAERAPDKAINEALIWQTELGGVPARHCEAYGLFVAGDYSEAAARMEQIAEDMRVGRDMPVRGGKRMVATAPMLADMYGQAATAWLLDKDITRAEGAIDAALSLTISGSSQEADLLVERARIAAADGDYGLAYQDLTAVYEKDPQRKTLLVLIAAAARGTGNLVAAKQAVEEYIEVYPEASDGHLEHGNLMDVLGNAAEAKASWLKVLELVQSGPDATAARANLERVALSSKP